MSKNGTPHNFMKVGELAPAKTLASQKTEKPANIKLNGISSQSVLVKSNPWAGCPTR